MIRPSRRGVQNGRNSSEGEEIVTEGRINLYSDTQSRPTLEMRQAMLGAEVGDEQKGLDRSVNRLCRYVADLLGKEAAVFLPSGTMCNEISILVQCKPGDEVYADRTVHILNFETGGPAALAGVNIYPLPGQHGIYTPEMLETAIRLQTRYAPRSRLVSVEQTSNLGGGTIWPMETIRLVAQVARSHELLLHLDGARLMNAVVASGIPARDYCRYFDSAWVDLSKGLGCPVGGVLAGTQSFIDDAWVWKQRLGGAMRQAGMLAAAGLYAFDHHINRLADDHENARRLGEIVSGHSLIQLDPQHIETNIVLIDISETGLSAFEVSQQLEQDGINIGAVNATVLRAITHLDIDAVQIEEAGQALLKTVDAMMKAPTSKSLPLS